MEHMHNPPAGRERPAVVRLMGGLGNQMFQYAFGRGVSEASALALAFDVESGFRGDVHRRRFALGAWNVSIENARPAEIPLGMAWAPPWCGLARAAWAAVPQAWRRVVVDRDPLRFDPSAGARAAPGAYFFGYWQNERYFLPIQEALRREFTLRAPPSAPASSLARQMTECRAVSLHVRRNLGVDASGRPLPEARELYASCSAEYYRRALGAVGAGPGTVCFVFSDDPAWARANLALDVPCRFVSEQGTFSDAEELVLMASCQHHVVANSSFSWWGAWLGANPAKIVVAPRDWLRGARNTAVDICPQSWIRI